MGVAVAVDMSSSRAARRWTPGGHNNS